MAKKQLRAMMAYMCFAVFTLFFGYECVRSASNTLFQQAYGTENLPVVLALMLPSMFVILLFYNKILSKMGPRRTLVVTSLACGVILFLTYASIAGNVTVMRWFLYIFREIYLVLILEQYWSFIDSTLDAPTAKSWNGFFLGSASIGSIVGGLFVSKAAHTLGTQQLLIFTAASVFPATFLANIAYKKVADRLFEAPSETSQKQAHAGGIFAELKLNLKLFRDIPMLNVILLLVVTTQALAAVIGLNFQSYLQQAIPDLNSQTAYSGQFYAILNGFSFTFQFLVAPLALKWFGTVFIQAMIPTVHVIATGAAVFYPSLTTVSAAFLLFKSFDYSFFRITKELLYVPLPFDARYRAKEFIDVFGYRTAKGGASLGILGARLVGLVGVTFYSWMSFGCALIWLALIVPILRKSSQKYRELNA
ncbi:MAG: Npt1/Npt2 family nucleotide transporter [Bacteriovoracia bacterium]